MIAGWMCTNPSRVESMLRYRTATGGWRWLFEVAATGGTSAVPKGRKPWRILKHLATPSN